MRLVYWLAAWLESRERHRLILDRERANRYLSRFYLIGSRGSRWFSAALHHFHRGDSDEHLHNHPWSWFVSIVLLGGYWEQTEDGWRYRRQFDIAFRFGRFFHRVELDPRAGDVWTLFIMGRKLGSWGFLTDRGVVDHDTYLAEDARKARARAATERLARDRRTADEVLIDELATDLAIEFKD